MQKDDAWQGWIAEGDVVEGDAGYGCWHDGGVDVIVHVNLLLLVVLLSNLLLFPHRFLRS